LIGFAAVLKPIVDIVRLEASIRVHVVDIPELLLAQLTNLNTVRKPVDVDVAVVRGRNDKGLASIIYESFSQLNGVDTLAVTMDEPTVYDVISRLGVLEPVNFL